MSMTKYKITADEAKQFQKHGVGLTLYDCGTDQVEVLHVVVEEGHFQEFFDTKSHFIYYIYEGSGLFVLNDEKLEVKATDLVAIPPKTRIYYFGKMKMILTVSPVFKPEDEVHVRFIEKAESPFLEL